MIQKVQNLILLLERMAVLYERTVGILEREKQALISFDFENILEVAREKDEVHSVLRSLDEDRLRIQDQFALIMQKNLEEVSLSFLAEALREHLPLEAKRLQQLRHELQEKIEVLRSRLKINKAFTEKSIENLQMIAANLSSVMRGGVSKSKPVETYTGQGVKKSSSQASGSIVEKRM